MEEWNDRTLEGLIAVAVGEKINSNDNRRRVFFRLGRESEKVENGFEMIKTSKSRVTYRVSTPMDAVWAETEKGSVASHLMRGRRDLPRGTRGSLSDSLCTIESRSWKKQGI